MELLPLDISTYEYWRSILSMPPEQNGWNIVGNGVSVPPISRAYIQGQLDRLECRASIIEDDEYKRGYQDMHRAIERRVGEKL